jgi:hypothetical protein
MNAHARQLLHAANLARINGDDVCANILFLLFQREMERVIHP